MRNKYIEAFEQDRENIHSLKDQIFNLYTKYPRPIISL